MGTRGVRQWAARVPRWRRVLAATGCAALVGTALSGCGRSAASPDTIVLYNGQHPETTQALVRRFEARTGIHVLERDGDEAQLAEQIEEEGPSSPADVFYSENTPTLDALDQRHLLAPVAPSTLAAVPAADRAADGHWVGVSARFSVLVYHEPTRSRPQLPRSVVDLADPRFAGKLALAPTETDFLPVVTSVARAEGDAATLRWLRGVARNAAGHIYPDNETVTAAVNRGQAELGIIDQYYWYRLRAEIGARAVHSAVAPFAPGDPGSVEDISGAAVVRSSHHRAQAQALLAFLVSAGAQRLIAASDSFEYPLRPGIAANPQLPPLSSYGPSALGVGQLGDGATALSLLQRAGLL